MYVLEQIFALIKVKKVNRFALLMIGLLSLPGCGGSSSTTTDVDNILNQPEAAKTLTFSEREYRLLTLASLEDSSIQTYWPADLDITDSLNVKLQATIVQIETLFTEQNFAFSQAPIVNTPFDYKQLILNKSTSDTNTNLIVSVVDIHTIELRFSDEQQLETKEFFIDLIVALYRSERLKYHQDKSNLQRLVTRGLALHFLQQNLSEEDFYFEVNIEASMLNQALVQLEDEQNGATPSQDWFVEQSLVAQVLANAVGYYLVEQHFSYYQGSNASNSFSLDSQLFLPWLDGSDSAIKKTHQYVRTSDVADQISVSELSRQADLFVGNYFIEGLNHEKLIALSFDDGPSQYTLQILDVLEQADVPASFFWQGQLLAQYPEVVQRSILAGHTVANHSWNHANGMAYTPEDLWERQVKKTNNEFYQQFKLTPRFYRPPYGEITDAQTQFLASKGMKVLLWSIDSRDWNPDLNSVEQIERELISHQHEEAITLMHDAGGNRQNTVDSLPVIIKHYKVQGYRFVNLETLLGIGDKH